MLHFINGPNFIDWSPLLLEILGSMSTVNIWYPVCDGVNFEFNHNLFLKPFFYITTKVGQTRKYLKKEKSFQRAIKDFMFKVLSIVRNCLKLDDRPLNSYIATIYLFKQYM